MRGKTRRLLPGTRRLLATSSVAALLIGGGMPVALAAPCTNVVAAPFDNPANTTVQNICITGSFTAPGSNVSNEGTISPSGIAFVGGTISGSILDTGVINGGISLDAASMITGNQVAISIGGSIFTGGISNAGTLSVSASAVVVNGPSTFSGGISNSGTITAAGNGINVGGAGQFTGGIVNAASGTIAATRFGVGVLVGSTGGPGVYNVSKFNGGISNAGSISSNSGTGIQINGVSTFGGGISNSGTISGSRAGIRVEQTVSFVGSIVNAAGGAISGGTGIEICNCVTSFLGGITNAGTIAAAYTGVFVNGIS
ncbi:MAG: hypothetical protein WBB34_05360, partial [Xanthobacteraceae bacterium]